MFQVERVKLIRKKMLLALSVTVVYTFGSGIMHITCFRLFLSCDRVFQVILLTCCRMLFCCSVVIVLTWHKGAAWDVIKDVVLACLMGLVGAMITDQERCLTFLRIFVGQWSGMLCYLSQGHCWSCEISNVVLTCPRALLESWSMSLFLPDSGMFLDLQLGVLFDLSQGCCWCSVDGFELTCFRGVVGAAIIMLFWPDTGVLLVLWSSWVWTDLFQGCCWSCDLLQGSPLRSPSLWKKPHFSKNS